MRNVHRLLRFPTGSNVEIPNMPSMIIYTLRGRDKSTFESSITRLTESKLADLWSWDEDIYPLVTLAFFKILQFLDENSRRIEGLTALLANLFLNEHSKVSNVICVANDPYPHDLLPRDYKTFSHYCFQSLFRFVKLFAVDVAPRDRIEISLPRGYISPEKIGAKVQYVE